MKADATFATAGRVLGCSEEERPICCVISVKNVVEGQSWGNCCKGYSEGVFPILEEEQG